MKQKILTILAAKVWFFLVFIAGLWLTFPSQEVAARATWEWNKRVSQEVALDLGDIRPAWIGVKGEEVRFLSRGKSSEEDATLLLALDSLKVKVGLLSLIRRSPEVYGRAVMGEGDVDFSVTLRPDDEGALKPTALTLDASEFPLSALPPIKGAKIQGTGAVDLELELAAEDGMGKANGRIALTGQALAIQKIEIAALEGFDLGEITIPTLDVALEVTSGRARVSKGEITTSMGDMELQGDMIFADSLSKTRLRLKIVFSLGEELSMVKGFLQSALWEDGRYHYALTGTVERPRWAADRERKSRPRAEGRLSPRDKLMDREGLEEKSEKGEGDVDLEARRAERLAERRSRLKSPGAMRPGGTEPMGAHVLDPATERAHPQELPPDEGPPEAYPPEEELALPEEGWTE